MQLRTKCEKYMKNKVSPIRRAYCREEGNMGLPWLHDDGETNLDRSMVY